MKSHSEIDMSELTVAGAPEVDQDLRDEAGLAGLELHSFSTTAMTSVSRMMR